MKRSFLLVVVCLFFAVGTCMAQSPDATVTGSVTDSSGAGMPGASVTLTNLNTNVVYKTATNESGLYRLGGLIPGTYRAYVSKDGFKSAVQDAIELHVEDEVALNFSLDVGSITQTVTVEATAPLIDAQSTTLGQVIEGQQVQQMPLNGRNVMNLVTLVPGVEPHETTSGSPIGNEAPSYSNPGGWANYAIDGATAGWNAQYLDGTSVNVSGNNWNSLVPTQDSVAEFKVDTNSISPQYGRFAGGVINFSTKSGSNQFHGTAYEYLRNAAFNANDFFAKNSGTARNPLKQNQFGGAIGGPIRRDKTFFFYSFEEYRVNTVAHTNWLVPTAQELTGDFTADPAIYDPTTGLQFQCNGVLNKICPARFDQTANYMANVATAGKGKYWFAQNHALVTNQGLPYNYIASGADASVAPQHVVRIDQNISEKQQLFGRFSYWSSEGVPTYFFSPTSYFPFTNNHTDDFVVGDTYTVSSSLAGSLRLSYDRFIYDVAPAGAGTADLTAYSPAWGTIGSLETIKSYPTVVGIPGGNIAPSFVQSALSQEISNHQNVYGLSANVTKISGKHSITFGGEVRRFEWYYKLANPDGGQFFFTGAFTGNPTTHALGNQFADFLLGMFTPISGYGIPIATTADSYNYYAGLFVTDTYKVSRRLTLNYGVRWELPGTWREKHDRDTVLLPNAPNPLGTILNPATGQSQALTGTLGLVNSPLYSSRDEMAQHWHLFDPRLGISYSASDRTVLRAGFGISNPSLDSGQQLGPSMSPVGSAFTQATGTLSNPFPGGILLPVGHNLSFMNPASAFPQTLEGSTFTAELPQQAFPYLLQWNANFARTFGRNMSLQAGYVGSRGVHLSIGNVDLNQLSPQFFSQGTGLLTAVSAGNNPFVASNLVGASSAIRTANSVQGQFLRPFPQFLNVNSAGEQVGFSKYDAFQLSFQTRLQSGGLVLVSYTHARTLTDLDQSASLVINGANIGLIQNYDNLAGEKSPSYFDIPNRLVVSYIVDLPFGRNKHFLTGASRPLNAVVSGWSFNGITTVQSGAPVSLMIGGNNALTNVFGAGTIRPSVVPGCNKQVANRTYQNWFNTGCFTYAGNFAFGNEPRVDGDIRQDGVVNFDFTLSKSTPITERLSAEFRAEAFNLLNHPQFGNPGSVGTPANPTGGAGALTSAGGFGVVSGDENAPRIIQLSLRLRF